MKIHNFTKLLALTALVLGLAVGCATAPKEEKVEAKPISPEVAQAIAAAKAAIKAAKGAGGLWRDTEKFLKKAEKAAKAGDDKTALKLAKKAQRQAELGKLQAEDEMRKYREYKARQAAAAAAAAAARAAAEAAAAVPPPPSAYTVVRGDNLWNISAKDSIYGNAFQWPLIYKANSDKIKDADLIYPGQEFTINRSASGAEIDAAVHHAKTRGAWALGVVEESDKAYLAR